MLRDTAILLPKIADLARAFSNGNGWIALEIRDKIRAFFVTCAAMVVADETCVGRTCFVAARPEERTKDIAGVEIISVVRIRATGFGVASMAVVNHPTAIRGLMATQLSVSIGA